MKSQNSYFFDEFFKIDQKKEGKLTLKLRRLVIFQSNK